MADMVDEPVFAAIEAAGMAMPQLDSALNGHVSVRAHGRQTRKAGVQPSCGRYGVQQECYRPAYTAYRGVVMSG